MAALSPGSYLVISHATDERSPEKMRANAEVAESSGAVLIPRSKDAILRMFNPTWLTLVHCGGAEDRGGLVGVSPRERP
jgi:hypothetical protein